MNKADGMTKSLGKLLFDSFVDFCYKCFVGCQNLVKSGSQKMGNAVLDFCATVDVLRNNGEHVSDVSEKGGVQQRAAATQIKREFDV